MKEKGVGAVIRIAGWLIETSSTIVINLHGTFLVSRKRKEKSGNTEEKRVSSSFYAIEKKVFFTAIADSMPHGSFSGFCGSCNC